MPLLDDNQKDIAREIVSAITKVVSKHTGLPQGKVPHNHLINRPLVVALNALLMPAMVRIVHRPDAPNTSAQQMCHQIAGMVWEMVDFDSEEADLVCLDITNPADLN